MACNTPARRQFSGRQTSAGPFGGDVRIHNEKSANLSSYLRVGLVLFRPLVIRGGVSAGHGACDTPGRQKAPSAIRCIKTCMYVNAKAPPIAAPQKAPSAKRCIKTSALSLVILLTRFVRKYRAPKGALRPHDLRSGRARNAEGQKARSAIRYIKTQLIHKLRHLTRWIVRKRRAPQGALRHLSLVHLLVYLE